MKSYKRIKNSWELRKEMKEVLEGLDYAVREGEGRMFTLTVRVRSMEKIDTIRLELEKFNAEKENFGQFIRVRQHIFLKVK